MASNNSRRSATIPQIDTYRDLPFFSRTQGEIYFIKNVDKLAVWDENKQHWHLINKAVSKSVYDRDEHNDRRGAIMEQRAKKGQA